MVRSVANPPFGGVAPFRGSALSHLAGITVKLQRKSIDIIEAHGMILEVTELYKTLRSEIDTGFPPVFRQG